MKAGPYDVLLHLYYGARVEDCTMDYLIQKRDVGFAGNPYDAGTDRSFSFDTLPQEFPSYGVGDYRNNCLGSVWRRKPGGRFPVWFLLKSGKEPTMSRACRVFSMMM